MQSEVPFYLLPNDQVKTQEIGKFDLFDYTPLEEKYDVTSSTFSGFGAAFDQAGDYVWDAVEGTWVSAKTLVNEGIASLGQAAGDIYSWTRNQIFIWVGGALIVIWIIAKSGILNQAAAFV